ncbi:hypothetical protein Tdes44962_MAKER07110 [Teratosphaeria destructans]|uniref:Uncharacterized protein n=1 Tax=Teratosphaeria destructans TaxID=418781 RepID=A0A9W7T0C6_9PEZI|nr:hypothetical protein Tdes44962_MAKER07110 [Teratosphaeria destructans]
MSTADESSPSIRRASRLVARRSATSVRASPVLASVEFPPLLSPDPGLAYPYTRSTDPEDLGHDDEKKVRASRSFGKQINNIIKAHERRRRPDLRAADNLFDFNFNDPDWIAMAFACKRTVAGEYSPGVYESVREIAEDVKGDEQWRLLQGEMLDMLYERRLEWRQHEFLFDLMVEVVRAEKQREEEEEGVEMA